MLVVSVAGNDVGSCAARADATTSNTASNAARPMAPACPRKDDPRLIVLSSCLTVCQVRRRLGREVVRRFESVTVRSHRVAGRGRRLGPKLDPVWAAVGGRRDVQATLDAGDGRGPMSDEFSTDYRRTHVD